MFDCDLRKRVQVPPAGMMLREVSRARYHSPMTNSAPAHSFATLVAVARRHAEMTTAEFDHSLAFPDGHNRSAHAALGHAAYRLVTEGLPAIRPGTPGDELDRRDAAAKALLSAHKASIDAMVTEAKRRSYTGWSNASRGPIRYA